MPSSSPVDGIEKPLSLMFDLCKVRLVSDDWVFSLIVKCRFDFFIIVLVYDSSLGVIVIKMLFRPKQYRIAK